MVHIGFRRNARWKPPGFEYFSNRLHYFSDMDKYHKFGADPEAQESYFTDSVLIADDEELDRMTKTGVDFISIGDPRKNIFFAGAPRYKFAESDFVLV